MERLRKAARYRDGSGSGSGDGGDGNPAAGEAAAEATDELAPLRPGEDEVKRARLIVDRAVARGDFDNLALAGKPIPGLGEVHDPDWWVKGLIQRENITGLGPRAILLRTEDAELDGHLDRQYSEQQVREVLEDFNYRVIDARRQLQGGPPVITKVRDIEAEVQRWRERRTAARERAEADAPPAPVRQSFWSRVWRGRS